MTSSDFLRTTAVTGALAFALLASGCGDGETPAPDPVPPKGGTQSPGEQLPETPDDEAGNGDATVSGEAEHRITDTGAVSVTCENGGEIYVEAAAEVTVTGDCQDIDVLADGASLTAEEVHDLDVEGNENQIAVDTVRELDIKGDGNTVGVITVREIDVEGSDNTVTYDEGSPDTDDEGTGNTIARG